MTLKMLSLAKPVAGPGHRKTMRAFSFDRDRAVEHRYDVGDRT